MQTVRKGYPETSQYLTDVVYNYIHTKHDIKTIIGELLGWKGEISYVDHHISHAASSFLTSPFDETCILVMDGVGEWTTTSIGYANNDAIVLEEQIDFPNSLGLFYSAFTSYLGFKINDGEYKVMGLAPYGVPKYMNKIKEKLINIKEDGSYSINFDYFSWNNGIKNYNSKFEDFFNTPTRHKDDKILQIHMDIAASVQKVLEEAVIKISNKLYNKYKINKLCIAGGVGLNCVINSRLLKETKFKEIYIHPASTDAGGAVGCGLYHYYYNLSNKIHKTNYFNPYIGCGYEVDEIKYYLDNNNIKYDTMSYNDINDYVASAITKQKVVGLFRGRSEWGPRALGNRSIVADATNKENWSKVNLYIKFRESFRPFAPSVLYEDALSYFDINMPSPYMLFVFKTLTKLLPATTHVDGSSRIQTVEKSQNKEYYDVISKYKEKSGVGAIINTSFNMAGQPIVNNPHDAYDTFIRTKMDILVLDNIIIDKSVI
jgi:carbamoyltransferase